MVKLFKEEFDSRIFKKNVFKLYLEKKINNKKIFNKQLKRISADIIFCFTIFDNFNIKILEDLDFNLISIRNTYKLSKNYQHNKIFHPKNFKFLDDINKIKFNKINQFAKTLLKTSRYNKDKKISKKIGEKIYLTWINNSFYKKYANKCIFGFIDNKIAGFITLKIKNHEGFIDLLAVLEPFQNKGLGSFLLKWAFEYFKNKRIDKIYVVTEGENIAANAFYQKNQFILKKTELVYHKHIN